MSGSRLVLFDMLQPTVSHGHVMRLDGDRRPVICASTDPGISSKTRDSISTFRRRSSNALEQCAMIWTTSSTKTWSGVILEYHT